MYKKQVYFVFVLLVPTPDHQLCLFATLHYFVLFLLDCVGLYGDKVAVSVFFNLRNVSRSPAGLQTLIRSHTNLPCR